MDILTSNNQIPGLPAMLRRERLIRLVRLAGEKTLVTITAAAGYGKTCLAADTLSRVDMNMVWIRLDLHHTDAVPEFIRTLETHLIKETIIVLDDYHLVRENQKINDALQFIIERAPARAHIVIISRKEPLLQLSRLRVMNRIVEISETDLAFTPEEIKAFCLQIHGLAVTDDHIRELHEKTGGWAASLVLFSYALKGKSAREIKDCLMQFKGSQKYIFSYLEENVFEIQPPKIREFMMKACLLSTIDPVLCNRVFKIDDAGILIRRMMDDHLLVVPLDETETRFIFHYLLKDYLALKLKQKYPVSEIYELHRRIASEIEADDIFQAVHHYIEGQEYDAAIRVIETHELKFLLEGKIHFLGQCLAKIPVSVVEQNPKLLFAEAKLFSYYGSPGEAILKLKAAYSLFKKKRSSGDMVKCLVDIGAQYYNTGYVKEAKLLMEQVLSEVDPSSATYVIAMTYLVFLTAVLGEFDASEKYTQEAGEIISGYPDFERGIALALNCVGLGRYEEAADYLKGSIEIFEMPCNRWGLANAWHCLHQVLVGQKKINRAKELLSKALDIIEGYDLTITEGILENSLGGILIQEERPEDALGVLNRARPKIQGASFYLFENYMLTARSYLLLNRQPEAIRYFTPGMDISGKKEYFRFFKEKFKDLLPLMEADRIKQGSRRFLDGPPGFTPGTGPPILTIRLLGRFRLFAGKNEIHPAVWKNSKALMILKYLASNRHLGFIPREVLIELLWPDQDFLKTCKRFNVAMSALRKVLEPGLPPKASSAYILQKKDAYRLCNNDRAVIDVERFLYEFDTAKKLDPSHPEEAMDCRIAAESYYKGSFLEEDPYEDWCGLKREHLNSTYLKTLMEMLRFHEKKKDARACIEDAKKILKADPYDENITRKLMGYYSEMGNTAAAKRIYAAYQSKAREMDCPVSPETTALLKNLTLNQK